jgi:hypothetical protein
MVKWALRTIGLVMVMAMVAGCSSTGSQGGGSEFSPRTAEPEDLNEAVIWQRPERAPDWLSKTPEDDTYLYFVGMSTPETYEIKARERSYNDAATIISRYIFTAAGYKWVGVDVGSNAHGSVMIQAIAQKSMFENISKAVVSKAYEVENFVQYRRRREYGAWVNYYRYYGLFRWPEAQFAQVAKAAAIGAQKDLQQQYEREVDAVKKQQLEAAMKTLKEIEEKGLDSKVK